VKEEAIVTDEGVVGTVTGDEIILRRDDGTDMRIKIDQQSFTMPKAGQRVQVLYKFTGTLTPVAVSIKER